MTRRSGSERGLGNATDPIRGPAADGSGKTEEPAVAYGPSFGPRDLDGLCCPPADLGDIVLALLSGTLSSLRDGLHAAGFVAAASVVADLADITDDYLARRDH